MGYDYDLFTLGAGSGGVRASRLAAMSGARVAVAEEYRVGGTCVIRGCVPKKFFVYAAEYSEHFRDAKNFGWTVEPPRFDWLTLRNNVAAEVDRLSGIYVRNLRNAGVEILHDRAEVVDPHTVRLVREDRTVTAERILVATGGAPYRPLELEGQEHAITSNEVFQLERLPRHVVVAGGGYIAVEFASIFAGLGVNTCLVYRGATVLRGFDDDVRTAVHEGLKRQGVRVLTGGVFSRIEKTGHGLRCHVTEHGAVDCDTVMLAIGRTPHTRGLGLENAGVALGKNGEVLVDAYSRSNVDSIWAVGDVTDRANLTPVAIREGQAFAETEFYGRPTRFDHADIATAVFSRPPAATVGLTEAEARRRLGKVDIYKAMFRPMKNVLSGNEARMLVKLVVEAASQKVVGVHAVGADAPEIIQLAAVAVKAGLTKQQWDANCAVHPTVAEEFVTLREKYIPPELAAAQ